MAVATPTSQHRLGDDRHACGWRTACAAGRERHELSRVDLAGGDVAAQQARAEQLARAWLGLGLGLGLGFGFGLGSELGLGRVP